MEDCNMISSEYIRGLVSIIMPTHNRVDIISETLDSIINQDYKNIEVLVIDDHCTDGTEDIVKRYVSLFPQISYYKSNQKGACAARNLGILLAKGEYIQFVDDDDWLAENFISKRLDSLIANPNLGFATCNMLYKRDKASEDIVRYFSMHQLEHNIETHLLFSALPAPLFLFRRSTIIKIGLWDESCLRYQDIRYYHRLFLYSIKGIWLPDYLYWVRLHDNSISKKKDLKTVVSICSALQNIEREWKSLNKCNKKLEHIIYYFIVSVLFNNCTKQNLSWIVVNFCKVSFMKPLSMFSFGGYMIRKIFSNKYSASRWYLE